MVKEICEECGGELLGDSTCPNCGSAADTEKKEELDEEPIAEGEE
jgi:uncharacterized Zn finger protein (UPF0148 family)